ESPWTSRASLSTPSLTGAAALPCSDSGKNERNPCPARVCSRTQATALQAVLDQPSVFCRGFSARAVFRPVPGLFPSAGCRAFQDRPAEPAGPGLDPEIPVGAGDRLYTPPPLLDGR